MESNSSPIEASVRLLIGSPRNSRPKTALTEINVEKTMGTVSIKPTLFNAQVKQALPPYCIMMAAATSGKSLCRGGNACLPVIQRNETRKTETKKQGIALTAETQQAQTSPSVPERSRNAMLAPV